MHIKQTSIIIPVYNKLAFTLSCLKDLFRQPEDKVDIIVIDNASTDDTQTKLQKLTNQNFRYIRNDTNQGFGAAINKAYSHTASDIVCILNNDIRVKDDSWLSTLVDAVEDNYLVGPTGGFVDPKKDFQFQYETSDNNKPINYMSGWLLAANHTTWMRLAIPREGDHAIQNQIFNEDFHLYYEDTDLGMRANKLGIKFKIIPDLPIVHFGKISSSQLNTAKWYNISRQIFLNKWKA
jgi:GT2 family glycosyltransferase